jgi:hypothetical protein
MTGNWNFYSELEKLRKISRMWPKIGRKINGPKFCRSAMTDN